MATTFEMLPCLSMKTWIEINPVGSHRRRHCVVVVLAHNNLTLDSSFNVLELVPVIGGLFSQALGGRLHLVLELSHNGLNITVEELLNLLNLLLVHVLGDFMVAGPMH